MNALKLAPMPMRQFVLVRWIGKWEGRECVDIMPIGLDERGLTDALLAIDAALAPHTTLLAGSVYAADGEAKRIAIAPYNFGGYLTRPIGIRVYNAPTLAFSYSRQVKAWLQEHPRCDGWVIETAS